LQRLQGDRFFGFVFHVNQLGHASSMTGFVAIMPSSPKMRARPPVTVFVSLAVPGGGFRVINTTISLVVDGGIPPWG
ncbi:MAG: hypothetical protein M3478_12380, partial [Planctomycetota bacterium]|nr:hypothetical protein [Planctomycetota bacterium]